MVKRLALENPVAKEISVPWLRGEASGDTSSAGMTARPESPSISRPTLPVAPTTANFVTHC